MEPVDVKPQSGELWLQTPEATLPFGQSFLGLGNLARALVGTALARKTFHPILFVTAEKAQARALVDDLRFFLGKERAERVHYFPTIDFDFYKGVLPNPDDLAERNLALFHTLVDPEKRIFVCPLSALLQKTLPPEVFRAHLDKLALNQEVDRDNFVLRLLGAGYRRQPVAYDPGTFSVRGGLMDIFTPLYPYPIRIEFYGDLIEQMRFYDPQTQRSLETVSEVWVLPLATYVLPEDSTLEPLLLNVKERLDALEIPKLQRDTLIDELRSRNHVAPFLFPVLSQGSSHFMDFLPGESLVVWEGKKRLQELAAEVELPRYQKNHDLFLKEPSPVASEESLFVSNDELKSLLEWPRSYFIETFDEFKPEQGADTDPPVRLMNEKISLENERQSLSQKSADRPALEAFARRFKAWMDDGIAVNVVCHTQTHEDRIRLLLEPYGIKVEAHPEAERVNLFQADASRLHLWQGVLSESAYFSGLRTVILSEEEIFGQKRRVTKSKSLGKTSTKKQLNTFRQLKEGDYVVHKDQGIGRYLGLKSMNFLGVPNEYVLIEYRDGDKLYVPSYRLNVVQKYVGGEGATVVLDKMGGERWAKAKKKAEKAAQELAGELLNIQAKRKMIPAHSFPIPGAEFRQFEMAFPFDETPDQMKAIEDTLESLSRSYPMDRLLVGDVGYGKTEVAMRASYLCVLAGKQACVVVPTTVLAFQHFASFQQRFKDTGATVEMVSRMKKPAEIKQTLERTRDGKVDILIGTHRLFSADVAFKELGLIVVDEEHRFGVLHKEKLKKISDSVHFLSMTATPIPRTLNMAMTGIKDISLITTPPPDRMAVRTFVCRRSDEVMVEAISNELVRDGQVFFLHNRVETIEKVAKELRELLPKAKIEVVHGQMEADELEKKMLGFYHGDFQVLVTTAIIESGLDIPRANTIVIDRADRLGLAQLYQLRGRVGRSAKRAYCYLLVPSEQEMTKDAKQRIQVIQRYSDLGAGFNVASYDLEIRGAGDLLGKEQSGHIGAVGVDMYFELLEESIRYLQGEAKKIDIEPEINLKIAAYFPMDYLPDVSERVNLYRQLSGVEEEETVSEIEEEIRDRFGTLPDEVVNLLGLMRIKLYLKRLHVTHLNCGPKKASLLFAPSTPVTPERIVELIKKNPKIFSVTPDNKLVFGVVESGWKDLLSQVQKICDSLLL